MTCAYSTGTNLECFQFREQSKKFEFQEILFPEAGSANSVMFSEVNQSARGNVSCTQCHGQDPRPNWEIYPNWQGAYGSLDDFFLPDKGDLRGGRNALQRKFESTNFSKFILNPLKRYQDLSFSHVSPGPYSKIRDKTIDLRPNIRFSIESARLTAMRDARILKEEMPVEARYEFLMLTLNCADEVSTSVGLPLPRSFRELLSKNISVGEWTPSFRALNPSCTSCGPSLDQIDPVGVAGEDSLPPKHWEAYAEAVREGEYPSAYDYYAGETAGNYPYPTLKKVIAEQLLVDLFLEGETTLQKYLSIGIQTDSGPVADKMVVPLVLKGDLAVSACKDIANAYGKISSALKNKISGKTPDLSIGQASVAQMSHPGVSRDGQTIVQTCMACHQNGTSQAPKILFNQASDVVPLLDKIKAKTLNKADPMPPSGLLSLEDRNALLKYLEAL